MRKPVAVAVLLIVPLLLLGLAGVSQAQLVLYDDFNVKPIDPARWFGGEAGAAGRLAPDTEAIRKIAKGQLEIDLTLWGRTDSDTGSAGAQSNRVSVTNPAPVTTFQADVTVKSATAVDCAANPTTSLARANMVGGFFNDGTSPGPGNRTGDIQTNIQKDWGSVPGARIRAFLHRCTNADCSTFSEVTRHTFATAWTKGVPTTLRMQWDQPNHQFIYTVNPGPSQEQVALPYAFSDTAPPVAAFRNLAATNSAASCQSGPRTHATMKALFDNVMVNP